MQKGSAQLLLIMLGVVILLSSAGLFFYSSQKKAKKILPVSPEEQREKVSDPKYSDKNLSYEFTYPADLIVRADTEEEFNKRGNGDFKKNFEGYVGYEPGQVLGAMVVLEKDENFETNPFSVWIFDNAQGLSIEKWFDQYWYYPFVWGVFDWTSKGHITLDQEATISGQLAKYKTISYQPGQPKFLYVSENQKMYLLRAIGEKGEKILSTFEIL